MSDNRTGQRARVDRVADASGWLDGLTAALEAGDLDVARINASAALDILKALHADIDREIRRRDEVIPPDPGDGRQWCSGCRRWKFLAIHSCPMAPRGTSNLEAGAER